jgi:hypothetical protein
MGHDELRRWLAFGCVLALPLRITLFAKGGVGGLASVLLFYAFALAVIVFGGRQFLLRREHGLTVPVLKWALLFGAVVSFCVDVILGYVVGSVGVLLVVSITCTGALLVLAIKDLLGTVSRRLRPSAD